MSKMTRYTAEVAILNTNAFVNSMRTFVLNKLIDGAEESEYFAVSVDGHVDDKAYVRGVIFSEVTHAVIVFQSDPDAADEEKFLIVELPPDWRRGGYKPYSLNIRQEVIIDRSLLSPQI